MLWAKMTAPQIAAAREHGAIAILPVGSTEQHGPHLPVDTDVTLSLYVAEKAAERTGDLVLPPVSYGYNEKDLAFAGTISLKSETFIEVLCDICSSLSRSGFKRIVIINGHGYNTQLINTVAHMAMERTDAYVAALNWWTPIMDVLDQVRTSPDMGTASHADEIETSAMLVAAPQNVDMSKAVREINTPFKGSRFIWWDFKQSPVAFKPPFHMLTQSGVIGDPTVATQEKGERLLSAAIERFAEFLIEFKRACPAEGQRKPLQP